MPYEPNPGHLPPECVIEDEDGTIRHRAVHVRLFGGWDSKKAGAAPWPAAGGRPPTRWAISRRPHPYEIEEYALA
jgi:hypothetical protein